MSLTIEKENQNLIKFIPQITNHFWAEENASSFLFCFFLYFPRKKDFERSFPRALSCFTGFNHKKLHRKVRQKQMFKMAARVGKVTADTSAFFLCDVQDKFRSMIRYFPEICTVANRMSAASKVLDIPLVVSEHYPKALGNIVPEIETSHGNVFPKTSFSMDVPDLKDHVKAVRPNLKSVILYGIEVTRIKAEN